MTIPFTLPPIVERELRVASRRGATYWNRFGAAASGMAIGCLVFGAQLAMRPTTSAGQAMFRFLSAIAGLTVVGSVLQLSSAAFAREKREDTLGLLFLTPLRPRDLVVGKLVSTSLSAFYQFLAIVPLLGLPMLTGGVSVANFAMLVLALASVIFLGATLGLYVSARMWDEKRATSVATAFMLALAVFPVLAMGVGAGMAGQAGALLLFPLSPACAIWQATVPGAGGSASFWISVAWTQFLGWIFFFAACRTLPRCWQNRPTNLAPTGEHLQHNPQNERPGSRMSRPQRNSAMKKVRRAVRRPFDAQQRAWLLDRNPVLWLAQRSCPQSSGVWVVGAIGLIAPAAVLATGYWRELMSPILALIVCFSVNAALKIYVAHQAGFVFARDHAENSLQLLLSTPLTRRQLIDGHMIALRQTLRSWIKRVLVIEAVWLALTITLDALHNNNPTVLYVMMALALLGFLIPDMDAVGWVALWRGVIARNARDAGNEAFARVLFLPWAGAFVVCWLVPSGNSVIAGLVVLTVAWIVFSAETNRQFSQAARRNLEAQLGLWALRRSAGEFEHYDGWRRVGRWLGRRWWRLPF